MTALVQLRRGAQRRVALVDEPVLRLLRDCDSVYSLAQSAIAASRSLVALIEERTTSEAIDYDAVYRGESEWRLLSPIDHPSEPGRLLVSGTGLTHLGSAKDRQAMHGVAETDLTDSMKMFRWGVEGGRPAEGQIGIAPEWFYKGNGSILRAHGEPLVTPPYAEDGGEEAEIAGVYIIAEDGQPWRIGMCNGNEFSDHRFEKRNYLNLASSKIRTCALGPEAGRRPELRVSSRHRGHRTTWRATLVQRDRHRRGQHVSQPAERRASSFQVRESPTSGRCARSLLRCVQLELRRRGSACRRRRDGSWVRRIRATLTKPAARRRHAERRHRHSQTRMTSTTVRPRVAILGLGLMGSGMARRLLGAGFPLAVYNRSADKAASLVADGARLAASPGDAAVDAEFIVSMVADDAASRGLWFGERGALSNVSPGAIVIESSTVTTGWINELADAARAKDVELLDAPVTGSRTQAASGELNFLVGGSESALERARPLFAAMGQECDTRGTDGQRRVAQADQQLSLWRASGLARRGAGVDRERGAR